MSRLIWNAAGTHYFGGGCSHGVLYLQDNTGAYPAGVSWGGLKKISRKPSGGEVTKYYADNQKYLGIRGKEDFGGSIEAFWYPDAFKECNGQKDLIGGQTPSGVSVSGQARKTFGLVYESVKGNEINGIDNGVVYHLIYGATVSPSGADDASFEENVDAPTMTWEFDTVPVNVTGFKPTAHLEIDGTLLTAAQRTALENALYGTDGQGSGTGTAAYLPLPDAVKTLIENAT